MPLRSLWGRSTTEAQPAVEPDATSQGFSWGRHPEPEPAEAGFRPDPEAVGDPLDVPAVAERLGQVIDPELGVDIVGLGLIYGIGLDEGTARVRMSLTTPGCPLSEYMEDNIGRVLRGAPGIDGVDVQIVWEPAWDPVMMSVAAKRQLGWPV